MYDAVVLLCVVFNNLLEWTTISNVCIWS